MNVTLSPELENAVRQKVASGEYGAVDEVIGEAIQRLIEDDREEQMHLDQIRGRIDAAEAQVDLGEYVEYDANSLQDLVEDLRERGAKRLTAERKQAEVRG